MSENVVGQDIVHGMGWRFFCVVSLSRPLVVNHYWELVEHGETNMGLMFPPKRFETVCNMGYYSVPDSTAECEDDKGIMPFVHIWCIREDDGSMWGVRTSIYSRYPLFNSDGSLYGWGEGFKPMEDNRYPYEHVLVKIPVPCDSSRCGPERHTLFYGCKHG